MARRSTRNLLRLFGAAEVDDQSIGPDVSDGIQLVYIVDDLAESTQTYAGTSVVVGAVVGEVCAFQLSPQNSRGIIIDSANIFVDPLPFGLENAVVATTAPGLSLTGATGPLIGLQSGPTPETNVESGTIVPPNFGHRWINTVEGLKGMFVARGQTLTVAFSVVNTQAGWGCRWRELSRS